MKKSTCKSFDDLPVFITVEEVADVLGIGRAHAYGVLEMPGFPAVRLGKRIVIHRDKFIKWIEKKADESLN